MKQFLFFIISLFLFVNAKAQDTLHTIKEIHITEKKKEKTVTTLQAFSSNTLQQYKQHSLQHLLQQHSNVFVKNYGISSLSTISIRGSSAAQTEVNWNGLNINNASTGLSDFNLLPTALFDNITIKYGSDLENKTVSGHIDLSNNQPTFHGRYHHAKSFIGYESMQNKTLFASYQYTDVMNTNRTKIIYTQANNLYSYYNPLKEKTDTTHHAKSNQIAILNDYYIHVKSKNILSAHTWLQKNIRQIPATTFENQSAKEENITSFRNVFVYETSKEARWQNTIHLGTIFEHYEYEDSLIHVKTKANTLSIPITYNSHFKLSNRQWAHAKFFSKNSFLYNSQKHSLHTIGISISYSFNNIYKNLSIKTHLQKELSNVFKLPAIGSLQLHYSLKKYLQLFTQISSNYRMPNLNELYYFPGGNTNLKPEKSKNIEAGFNYEKKYQQHDVKFQTAIYKRQVQNWIAWYGNAILTPHNIQAVESKGVECIVNYDVFLNRYKRKPAKNDTIIVYITEMLRNTEFERVPKLVTSFLYAYTLSTTQQSIIPNDYSIGKQIPYVPRYQFKMNIGIQTKNMELMYNYNYTGYRFVTTDETQWLLPYSTHNLFYTKHFRYQALKGNINIRCNNILNKHYESIVGRVMPTRNASIGVMLFF